MKDFRNLRVWQDSHLLTLEIYRICKRFPTDERFGLISQMRRSASSIPTNIAEGCGREGDREFARFLQISIASAYELDYQLFLAKELGYINTSIYDEVNDKIDKVKRQLALLIRKVRTTNPSQKRNAYRESR